MPSTMPGAADAASSIPPYVQLFYENGDQRDCDPLPIYKTVCEADQPPPFSPLPADPAADAVAALPMHAPIPRPPSVPTMSDELPEPGQTYRTGAPDSRPPSPPSDEDDPMDGTDEDIGSSAEESTMTDMDTPMSEVSGSSGGNVRPEARPTTGSPAITSRIARLNIPGPPRLPEMAFSGAMSPIRPPGYPFPGATFMDTTAAPSAHQTENMASGSSSRSVVPGFAGRIADGSVPPSPTIRSLSGRKPRQPRQTQRPIA